MATAYIVGHVGQGIGNAIVSRFVPAEEHVIDTVLDPEVVSACRAKVQRETGTNTAGMSAKSLYKLCDDAVLRSGKLGEREVYVYREGFYRGTFVGMLFLVVGTVLLGVRLLGVDDSPPTERPAFLAMPSVWCVLVTAVIAIFAGSLWDKKRKRAAVLLALVGVV